MGPQGHFPGGVLPDRISLSSLEEVSLEPPTPLATSQPAQRGSCLLGSFVFSFYFLPPAAQGGVMGRVSVKYGKSGTWQSS